MAAIAPTAQVRGTVELALRGSKRDSPDACSRARCSCPCSCPC